MNQLKVFIKLKKMIHNQQQFKLKDFLNIILKIKQYLKLILKQIRLCLLKNHHQHLKFNMN
jgi:hypothetical protein